MCRTNLIPPSETEHNDTAFAAKLAALAEMPVEFATIAAAIPAAQRRTGARDGNFSLHQHLCHLRDIEIEGYRARIERMLAEERPALADLNGATLARARDYHRQDLGTAEAAWAAIRADLVRRLAGLTPEQRRRTGVMEGVGEITIDGLVEMMLAHDAEHRRDLAALRDELAS